MFQQLDDRQPVLVLGHADMAAHGYNDHDEHPGRLIAVEAGIASAVASGLELVRRAARPASDEDLRAVHAAGYLAALAAGTLPPTRDNPITPGTWHSACLAAGAAAEAAVLTAAGPLRRAFCATRPPGHHAHADHGGGFCYLNNAVVAARRFQALGFGPVAVLDLDYHHGDGTAALALGDPGLWYGSIHADPAISWPGTGEQVDHPRARHIPLPRPAGDARWLAAVDHLLIRVDALRPRAVVLSFGSDALAGDPVGDLGISQDALASAVRRIVRLFPELPLVSVLEGGYDEAALSEAVARHLHALAG